MRFTLILATSGIAVALAACATTPKAPPLQTCADGSQIPADQPCPPPPPPAPPPPPPMTTCPDGTQVPAGATCPIPPPPPPPPRRAGERG